MPREDYFNDFYLVDEWNCDVIECRLFHTVMGGKHGYLGYVLVPNDSPMSAIELGLDWAHEAGFVDIAVLPNTGMFESSLILSNGDRDSEPSDDGDAILRTSRLASALSAELWSVKGGGE